MKYNNGHSVTISVDDDVKLKNTNQGPAYLNSSILWGAMIASCVLMYGSYAVLVHLSKENDEIKYNSSSVVLLIELFKLIMSIAFLNSQIYSDNSNGNPQTTPTINSPTTNNNTTATHSNLIQTKSQAYKPANQIKSSTHHQYLSLLFSCKFILPFAVPAILYCSNNNLAMHLQNYMDPATYQVLSNLKILSTAILYRIIIKRALTYLQWLSLFLLFLAGCGNSIGNLVADQTISSSSILHITTTGVLGILVYSVISGLSGVYCEYILKDRFEVSIHLQNIVLYIFGVTLNLFTFVYYAVTHDYDFNLTRGFNGYVYLIIFTQSLIGIIFSMVMKHSSNITRLFIISLAAVVTTILSVIVFGIQLNAYFSTSFVVLVVALVMYHV